MEVGETLVVPPSAEGTRLDLFLLHHVRPGVTRGDIQRAIRERRITVKEKHVVKPGTILHAGQTVEIPPDAFPAPVPAAVRADATIPLRILHEDPHLLVVDKPAGLPVHAGVRRAHPTLADALLARYPNLTGIGEDPRRPGIVHRLDKDTSGVLLIARTPEMFEHLKRQFQLRQVRKQYLALVRGTVTEEEGIVKLPLARSRRNPARRTVTRGPAGKAAETMFRVRERFPHYTLLDVFPITGRMHQIRVHLAHLGFPIVSDPLYGKRAKDPALPPLHHQFLHAASITVELLSGKTRTFESSLPGDLQGVLDVLRHERAAHRPVGPPVTYRMRFPRSPRRA